MSVVAEYLPRDSVVHRLHPLSKLLWSLLTMLLSFLFKDPVVLTLLFLTIVGVAILAGIIREMLPVFKGLLIFVGLFLLLQIFFISDGQVVFSLVPGTDIFRITDLGLTWTLAMGARMLVISASFPVLMGTTQVKDMVVVLVERLKIPYTYAFMFVTSLRFVPTFMQEMDQIIQAQCSRAHRLDSGNFLKRFLSICPLAIPLVVSSVKKAEQLAISMETRGFGNGSRTYLHQQQFRLRDRVVCGGMIIVAVAGLILNIKGILV